MDDHRLKEVMENAPSEQKKLLVTIDETKLHSQQQGSKFDVLLSYETAALAYPWPSIDPSGINFRHNEGDLDVPYLYEREFEDAMEKIGLRVEKTGTNKNLYDDCFRLVFLDVEA
jgi:hypothetical protein